MSRRAPLKAVTTQAPTCQGVVFAANAPAGEAIRDELGLTDWLVVTPRSILRLRGRIIEPRLLLVGGCNPYEFTDDFAAAFNTDQPAVYWLTGGAL